MPEKTPDMLIAQAVREMRAETDSRHRMVMASLERLHELVEQLHGMLKAKPTQIVSHAAQVPSQGTCWSCLWYSGVVCQRQGSPRCNEKTAATDTCEKYVPTQMPRTKLVEKVGHPGQLPRHARAKRPTRTCDRCGNDIKVTATGKLYRHDLKGRLFAGLGGADRSKECTPKGGDI